MSKYVTSETLIIYTPIQLANIDKTNPTMLSYTFKCMFITGKRENFYSHSRCVCLFAKHCKHPANVTSVTMELPISGMGFHQAYCMSGLIWPYETLFVYLACVYQVISGLIWPYKS